MAGAVAMASVIEDFDTQPCKKQRKDGDTTSVQPITNYFLPMPKPTEKPFSPPKSHCITDYFKRTSPALEKSSMSEQSSDNLQDHRETPGSNETPIKAHRFRRSRKSSRVLGFNRQAQGDCTESPSVASTPSGSSCSNDESASVGEEGMAPVILGSETAALLAEVITEAFGGEKTPSVESSAAQDSHHNKGLKEIPKRRASVRKKLRDSWGCSLESREENGNESNGDAGVRSPQQCDVRAGDSKAAGLNDSTITISFEEFLRSQNQAEAPVSPKAPADDSEEPCVAAAAQSEQQVSPRTLTVQAEVHPVSNASELGTNTKKRLASIFTRRWTHEHGKSEVEGLRSSQEKPESLPAPRRKSNVVLHEEDLELAVIEPGSTPKCSQVERKQFMNAFRQTGLETGKTSKPKRGPSRQEPAIKTAPEVQEDPPVGVETTKEEGGRTSATRPPEDDNPDRSGRKIGSSRLRRGGRKNIEEPSLVPAMEEKPVVGTNQKPAANGSNTPAVTNAPRRSTRGRPQETALESNITVQSPQTRSQKSRKGQRLHEECSPGDFLLAATPTTRKVKRDMYRAEMLSPPDSKESPIRMRFRRVLMDSKPKSGDGSDLEILSPVTTQVGASKSRVQAKKLLRKARALRQNKKTSVTGDKGCVRRSLRNRNLRIAYCEDEDSVVCLDDDQENLGTKEKAQGQKQLRSLNEVLGKTAAVNKAAKGSTAPRVAPVFLGKKGQKPSAVISIFDESSREGSENSQDDEQFKARREFLKSGLPESFRKQIARTTASQDAYSTVCASFQAVVHVLQKTQDCPLWNLPWPGSALFKHLETSCLEPPKPVVPLEQLGYAKTLPAPRTHKKKGSGWREDLSEQVRKCLLEEVRASNPQFPVRRFFTRFLKKRADHLLQCLALDSDESQNIPRLPASSKSAGKKRKCRLEDEGREGLPKRRRSSRGEPIVIEDSPLAGVSAELPGRSRTRRQKKQEDESMPVKNGPIIVLDDSATPPGHAGNGGCVKEDVLWTEKYQPQHSGEVVGNSAAVKKLHSWLKDWKLRADREERRNQKERKLEDDSNDCWDSGDFRGEEGSSEEQLCNTLLITGPSGVGKTAAVYACAQELGFKVFEVNASSQRSGRHIMSQLKEATQSHQVDLQGAGIFKPSYFNSYSAGSVRCGTSPRKGNSPRKVVSSPRKPPLSPRGTASKRGNLAPTTLASFFNICRPMGKTPDGQAGCLQRDAGKSKKSISTSKLATEVKKGPTAEDQSKKAATSLILFEEVDVIFEDDSGFLAAIKTFMTTTKRPVILTTSDPTFRTLFDGDFEEIHFKTPSAVNVRTYLQLVCLAENVRTDTADLSCLLRWTGCDVRQSLLQLQFWVRGGGGRPAPRPILASGTKITGESGSAADIQDPAKDEEPPAGLPPCDTSCTESLLGLLNIEPSLELPDLCKWKSPTEPEIQRCWELLSDSWGRGVALLYSNMEHLLPLPSSILGGCDPKPLEVPQEEVGPCRPHPPIDELLSGKSPVKVSSSKRDKIHPGRDAVLLDEDSDGGFLSLCEPPQTVTSKSEEIEGRHQSERCRKVLPVSRKCLGPEKTADCSPTEQQANKLVSSCLDSLAEFLDHMSFLDSSLVCVQEERGFQLGAFGWTGAGVKDGLTDELGNEPTVKVYRRSAADIRAAVEGMSFRRCQAGVEQVWMGTQELGQEARDKVRGKLSLPVAPHRQGFSLGQISSCELSVVEKRSEVVTTVSSRVLGILGNKSAAATDYLPTLRTICRSERLKEQGKVKRRFLHYLDSIYLNLPRSTVQRLAEDFP